MTVERDPLLNGNTTEPPLQTNPFNPDNILGQLTTLVALTESDLNEAFNISSEFTPSEKKLFLATQVPKSSPQNQLKNIIFSLYEQRSEPVGVQEFVDSVIERHKLAVPADSIYCGVEQREEARPLMERRSADIVHALEYVMHDDPDNEYIVLNILAAPSQIAIKSLEVRFIQDMAIAGAHYESDNYYDIFANKLKTGAYDSQIAREFLTGVINADSPAESKVREETERLLILARRLAPEQEDGTLIQNLTEPESLAAWPYELQKYLDKRREQLQAMLRQRYAYRKTFMTAAGYITELADLKHLEQHIRNNPELQTGHAQGITKVEAVRQQREQRNRKRTKAARSAGKVSVRAANTPSAETAGVRQRVITLMDTHGNIYDEGSEQFIAMQQAYYGQYKGVDLQTTLEQAIDYLKSPDSTNGTAKGIRPLTDGVISIEASPVNQLYRVYRLRPDQTPHVATPNRLSGKMRIYFVVNREDRDIIHILGVENKDNSRRLLRCFGINVVGEK